MVKTPKIKELQNERNSSMIKTPNEKVFKMKETLK